MGIIGQLLFRQQGQTVGRGTVDGFQDQGELGLGFRFRELNLDHVATAVALLGDAAGFPLQNGPLFTADLHPRAGYPAIAGLVETLQGLDFRDGAEESDGAYLFSFAGEKNGFKGVALAGWLEENKWRQEVRTVRIRTDAKRAFRVDIFGNRTPAEVGGNGLVEMTLAATPGAFLLEGASEAQIENFGNN